jgi:hypothetical protein
MAEELPASAVFDCMIHALHPKLLFVDPVALLRKARAII